MKLIELLMERLLTVFTSLPGNIINGGGGGSNTNLWLFQWQRVLQTEKVPASYPDLFLYLFLPPLRYCKRKDVFFFHVSSEMNLFISLNEYNMPKPVQITQTTRGKRRNLSNIDHRAEIQHWEIISLSLKQSDVRITIPHPPFMMFLGSDVNTVSNRFMMGLKSFSLT